MPQTASRTPTAAPGRLVRLQLRGPGDRSHSLERVSAIDRRVFVANGDSGPVILPRYSYLLAGVIPGARLKIYPDAAHGFLFHHAECAGDVGAFPAGV
jgi:hypothetical protein